MKLKLNVKKSGENHHYLQTLLITVSSLSLPHSVSFMFWFLFHSQTDNSATVSCSNNYMRIELDRKFYNASLYSSITLRMESCKASIYSSSIVLGSVPGACGSVRSETSSHIVYENEVIFTGKPINGLITRNVDQRVKFSCMYDKNAYVQTVSYQPVSNVTGVEGMVSCNTFEGIEIMTRIL